jgi:hypothetical protein
MMLALGSQHILPASLADDETTAIAHEHSE